MIGIVLLAAGASTRLGKPKQKLVYEGNTLLRRAAETALSSACDPVVVVLGASAEAIQKELLSLQVEVALNSEWETGMASSIRCGLSRLLHLVPALDACLLLVCDQPFVDAAFLNQLLQAKATAGKGIAASAYEDTLGTPVVFDKIYFEALLSLKGQQGARLLVKQHLQDVVAVPFSKGAIDVDTPADYKSLLGLTSLK